MLLHSEHKYLGSILLFIDSVCLAIETVICFLSDLLGRLPPSKRKKNTKIIKKKVGKAKRIGKVGRNHRVHGRITEFDRSKRFLIIKNQNTRH